MALSFDVIQLAGLLYLTRGLTNPFSILFLAPIAVSAALLGFISTAVLVIVVGVSASLLSRFHLPLPLFSGEFSLPPLYLTGLLTALMVSALFEALPLCAVKPVNTVPVSTVMSSLLGRVQVGVVE